MATAQLARIQTVRMPLAVFCYGVLVWVPIAISALLMVAWQAITGQQLPILGVVVFLVVLRQVNIFTLSTLFHRSYSHRQFTYHPLVEHPMRVWNWLWCGTGGRAWSILHRWHHAAGDTQNDPHSPTKDGGSLWNVTRQTFRSYQECLHNPEQYKKFEYKLPDDKFEHFVRWLEKKGLWGIVVFRLPIVMAIMSLFMPLPAAVLSIPGIVGSVWFSTVVVVNGLCHIVGYRVMDSGDTSTNLFPIDFLGWGEALHHNHHFNQGKANLAIRGFEFDPGYWTLYAMSKVGLVRDLKA